MAYKLAVLEILRNLFVLAYIACPRYPYILYDYRVPLQCTTYKAPVIPLSEQRELRKMYHHF